MMLVGGTLYTLLRSRLARTTHSNSVAEEAYLSNYSAQIDHIAKRLRKLNVARWIVAIVLAISSAFLISCPGLALPLTSLMHWAPNTQYLVPAYPGYSAWLIIPALVGFLALFALIGECLLLHIARSEPIAFRRAFQDEVLVRTSKRRDDIALLVLLGVFSVAGLFVIGSFLHSYVQVTDKGVAVCAFPGLDSSFHDWSQVASVSEVHLARRYGGRGGGGWRHVHYQEIDFSNAVEWKSGYSGDPGYESPSDGVSDTIMKPMMYYVAKRSGHPFQMRQGAADYGSF